MSQTDITRWFARCAFGAIVLAGLVGWLALSRDPEQLQNMLTTTLLALGVGEGSNVAKRITFKKEAVGHDEDGSTQ